MMASERQRLIKKIRKQIAEFEALEQPGAGERLMKEMRREMNKEETPCTK